MPLRPRLASSHELAPVRRAVLDLVSVSGGRVPITRNVMQKIKQMLNLTGFCSHDYTKLMEWQLMVL